jgi:hypothetical protein
VCDKGNAACAGCLASITKLPGLAIAQTSRSLGMNAKGCGVVPARRASTASVARAATRAANAAMVPSSVVATETSSANHGTNASRIPHLPGLNPKREAARHFDRRAAAARRAARAGLELGLRERPDRKWKCLSHPHLAGRTCHSC